MSIHRFLIVVGILALLLVSYLSYKEYQSYVEVQELIIKAVTFTRSLDKETQSAEDSPHGLSINETELSNTRGGEFSKKPVKVKILSKEEVGKYSNGDMTAAVRVVSKPRAPVPARTWTADEMVTQWVALPNGETIKLRLVPGQEIQAGDRVSPQYIENHRDRGGIYIESEDGQRYNVPDGADPDDYEQKVLWANTLDVSIEEVERLIASGRLVVKGEGEFMTEADTEINFNLLRKIPKFLPLLRSIRPDLVTASEGHTPALETNRPGVERSDEGMRSSPDQKIERHVASPADPVTSQSRFPSEPSTVSSPETDGRNEGSLERVSKAQQLIDQYGTAEGLRRLREMDPEAARQFEQGHRPSRDAPDKGQSESGSKD